MKYRVTIRKDGASTEARTIEAASRFAVYDQVQKEGGTVVDLKEGGGGFALPKWLDITIGTGVKRAEVIRFAKNLAAMLTAGLSLSRALSVIERQSSNKSFKAVVGSLSESVKKGSPFNEALASRQKVFPALFIAMVKAGEESGSLADALNTVGIQMERAEQLTKKVKGAMIYPTIVITAMIIVAVLMLMYVVPTLTSTFTSLKMEVPTATRVIMAVSDFLINNSIIVLIGLVAVIGGGITFVRSKKGLNVVLRVSLYMPVIGELVRETYAARAARTLSSLLTSGVPVLEALSIARDVVGAPLFADVITETSEHVKKGEPLSKSFAAHQKLYPILMSDMMAVGEETGKVVEMMKQIAEYYEADVSEKTKDLSTIIEPVLMLLVGGGVGIFAVAMIAPIYSLSSAF